MGKTRTFVDIAMDIAIKGIFGVNFNTAIMVHRKELVQQISLTLCEYGVHHNIIAPDKVIQGIVSSQRKEFNKQFYQYNAPISVISVDTLNARIYATKNGQSRLGFWITDEAAHLLKIISGVKPFSIFRKQSVSASRPHRNVSISVVWVHTLTAFSIQ